MKRFYNNLLSHTAVIPDPSTRGLLARIMAVTTYAVGGVVLMGTVGIDTTPLLAAAGISGATLGFSAKDVGANAVAAMTLAAKRPFEHGTKMTVGSLYKGTIDHWDLQYLYLRGEKDELILIPNSVAFTSVLTIHNPTSTVFDWDSEGNKLQRPLPGPNGTPGAGWHADGTAPSASEKNHQQQLSEKHRGPFGKLGVTMFIVLILLACVEAVAVSLSWASEKTTSKRERERERAQQEAVVAAYKPGDHLKNWFLEQQQNVLSMVWTSKPKA